MGFEEIPHTADCAVRVWAPDVASLFVEAALSFNAVAGARIGEGTRISRELLLQATDLESLLVDFLSELTFAQEQESLGFDEFHIVVTCTKLTGRISGSRLELVTKPIKAVTYHGLEILSTERGYEVELVFDV